MTGAEVGSHRPPMDAPSMRSGMDLVRDTKLLDG